MSIETPKKLGASESELSDLLCDEFRSIAVLAAKMLERDETPARTELAADLRAATGKMLTKIKYMHSAYVKLTNCDQYGEGGEIKGHFCPNELLKEFDLSFTNEEISKMNTGALEWWNKYKPIIEAAIKSLN